MSITVKDANSNNQVVLTLDDIADLVGEVQATPTTNTLLSRLKDISDALGGTITVDTDVSALVQESGGNLDTIAGLLANVATESTLSSIDTALSDVATQTTLAAVLAKIIAASSTEAKQDALAALVGEVQASPTTNTLLDRLKTLNTTLSGTLTVDTDVSGLALESGGNLADLVTAIGEVQDSPTSYTVLDRLKLLESAIYSEFTKIGDITGGAPTANTVNSRLDTINSTANGVITVIGAITGGAPASNTVNDRLKTINDTLSGGLSLSGSVSIAAGTAHVGSVTPEFTSAGHTSATSNGSSGSSYVAFSSQACKQLTIFNDTGTKISVRQGATGVAVPIWDGTVYTFYGIADADELDFKRSDESTTAVTIQARWES